MVGKTIKTNNSEVPKQIWAVYMNFAIGVQLIYILKNFCCGKMHIKFTILRISVVQHSECP